MLCNAVAKRLVLLAALTACGSGAASAKAMSEWKLHGWLVGAYTNDTTKQFSHCAASIKYRSGILLLFSVTKDFRWMMGFANPEWRLNSGSRYQISYAVDAFPALETTAVAITANQVVAELPPKTGLFQLFRKGRILKVRGQGKSFGFNLNNTSSVLAEVLRCANRFKSTPAPVASSTNPFEKPTPPAAALNSGQNRAEAMAVTANVLSSAGIQGFSLISDIPESLKFLDAIWKAPGVIGGLQILEKQTPISASSQRIAVDAQNCRGTFASGKLPASGSAVRVMTACTTDGKEARRTEYTIVQRKKGGVYVFITMASGNTNTDVSEHGTRVMDAALKSLN
jgi:hypothetical protein